MTQLNVEIIQEGPQQIIEVLHEGPRGPRGPAGTAGEDLSLQNLIDVDVGGKVNNSLLFYSAAENKFLANNTTTTSTIIDGGNF